MSRIWIAGYLQMAGLVRCQSQDAGGGESRKESASQGGNTPCPKLLTQNSIFLGIFDQILIGNNYFPFIRSIIVGSKPKPNPMTD
jgi:hypothetical protein